jgi:hypothetical protein
MKRESSISRNCRLLCPDCGEVKQVEEVAELITLQCGHARPEILPLERGRVSIEHMRTAVGRRLFPARPDDVSPAWVELRVEKWR